MPGPRLHGHTNPPDPRLQQFMRNALDDLTRPAPPVRYSYRVVRRGVQIAFTPPADPRVEDVLVLRANGTMVCKSPNGTCFDRGRATGRLTQYAGVTVDEWGMSQPLVTNTIRLRRGAKGGSP